MHPGRDDLVTDGRLRLRDLVLVVGELVVVAARVDVEAVAEVLHRHRRALDVPPGVAVAPRARPLQRAVGAGLLPQREVLGVTLVRVDRHLLTVSRAEPVERVARELAVAGERRDVVVDAPVDLVRVALLEQRLDQLDHVVDVLGGARVQVGAFDPHQVRVLQERVRVLLRDLGGREPLVGLGELHLVATGVRDLVRHVPDVGDVHDPPDLEPLEPERPADQVAEHERAHVPDVDVAVDGRAARVDLHGLAVDGRDVVELTREGVVQTHGQPSISPGWATPVATPAAGTPDAAAPAGGRCRRPDARCPRARTPRPRRRRR